MKRGDVVVVAMQGDCGKPRPAVVVQADLFNATHASITLAPVTSTIVDAPLFRVIVEPSSRTGLRSVSQVMMDKLTTVRRDRIRRTIGHLEQDAMQRVSRALSLWLGLAA
jgi:mRNA interferase MazF